jgi:hypothetical protein
MDVDRDELDSVVGARLGEIEMRSDVTAWDGSRYYEREMGPGLRRQFLALRDLQAREELVAWKLAAQQLEADWSRNGLRRVNVDPGYVTLEQLVLASTKVATQRVYLGKGVYAEATLRFVDGLFRPWPYTYPDYARADACEFFTQVRLRLRRQLRLLRSRPGG